MKRYARPIAFAGLAAFVIGAVGAWLLIAQPFGYVFDTFVFAAWLGLVLLCAGAAAMLAGRGAPRTTVSVVLVMVAAGVLAGGLTAIVDLEIILNRGPAPAPTTAEWIADLDTLAARIRAVHPNPFEQVGEVRFDGEVRALADAIPSMTDDDILAGFARIVALSRDAPCIPNVMSYNLGWHMLPLSFWWFEDGLRVTLAPRERKELLGCRVVAVEETPVEEAMERMRRYLTAEAESGWLSRGPLALSVGEWLVAEGIASDPRRIALTFEGEDGERFTERIGTVHYLKVAYWSMVRPAANDAHPVGLNDRRDNYTFEMLPDKKTVIFRFHAVVDLGGERSLGGFLDSLSAFVKESRAKRLVIDLRSNSGGNGHNIPQVVDMVRGLDGINNSGRLYVLIGRRTFSAAVMTASVLRNNTRAILVGEPTGQGPDFYSSPTIVRLPHCKREFFISTRPTFATPVSGDRDQIEPNLFVRETWEDVVDGRDAALQAVLDRVIPRVGSGATNVDEERIEKLVGRYRLDPWQAVEIVREGRGGWFRIVDGIEGSLRTVDTPIMRAGNDLMTGIPRVSFHLLPGTAGAPDSLRLDWRGTTVVAPRMPADRLLPMELVAADRLDEGLEAFRREIAPVAGEMPHLETILNRLGYRYLRDDRKEDAIVVFELNTELYPRSANTWDSLGEGCMEAGRTEDAIRFYEKSLELNPGNDNARRMLERLRTTEEGSEDA